MNKKPRHHPQEENRMSTTAHASEPAHSSQFG